jgi:hypothetical protein
MATAMMPSSILRRVSLSQVFLLQITPACVMGGSSRCRSCACGPLPAGRFAFCLLAVSSLDLGRSHKERPLLSPEPA